MGPHGVYFKTIFAVRPPVSNVTAVVSGACCSIEENSLTRERSIKKPSTQTTAFYINDKTTSSGRIGRTLSTTMLAAVFLVVFLASAIADPEPHDQYGGYQGGYDGTYGGGYDGSYGGGYDGSYGGGYDGSYGGGQGGSYDGYAGRGDHVIY
ncbi:uncharacterized protein LOC126267860 [Schistocerca gregaria]|uniref:uncharacterized protein LOC126267860 n=1 Tax=Schistocerca gregaria TaxID=7010 RepID=UPI00211F1FD7|nr:uncharacterized protein LOC126267860 [Schistocerca gregaria]